jgi:hypothetical protein
MKSLGKKNKDYIQGKFCPKNIDKYKGTFPIIYRSSMELKSMRWMDNNNNVLKWTSETIIIPYISPTDGKMHRYFTDLSCEMKMKDGSIKKLLIEVKPEKQTLPPVETARKKQKTILYERYNYAVNCAKWEAAKKWCSKKGYMFLILTEKHLS